MGPNNAIQTIIVLAIVAIALILCIRHFVNMGRKKDCGCGCGENCRNKGNRHIKHYNSKE